MSIYRRSAVIKSSADISTEAHKLAQEHRNTAVSKGREASHCLNSARESHTTMGIGLALLAIHFDLAALLTLMVDNHRVDVIAKSQ